MTKLDTLLDEYEESHRHPVNIKIHWIAEPLAIFALMALTYAVSLLGVSLLWPFLAVMLLYFASLSVRVALAFGPVVVIFVLLIVWIDGVWSRPIWHWAAPLFVVAGLPCWAGTRSKGGRLRCSRTRT